MNILFESEKQGGRPIWGKHLYLREFMQKTGAIDLGFSGPKFTWNNGHEGTSFIRERIDKAIANREWLWNFEEAKVSHLCAEVSDHIPILIRSHTVSQSHQQPFRFLKVWTEDTSSEGIVQNAWNQPVKVGMESHRICQKLLATSMALSKWNRDHFGHAK